MTTTRETSSPVETTNALLDALDALLPEVAERAAEAERLRTMPPGLVPRAEAAGLFRMLRVRALGGLEVDPPTVVDVVERLAHADASAAWTVLIGTTANAFFGWLDPGTAREMLEGCPNASSTCVFAPGGAAVLDGSGGFTVSGRWKFNSGIAHSAWRQVGVIVHDANGPRTGESGAPDVRIAFVPASEGEVCDTWEVMGLQGTGSHDLILEGVSVPAERMITIAGDNQHDGVYARLPLFSLVQLGVIGFPLGIARRALEEFTALAREKTRGMGAQWSVVESSHVQADLGRAEGELMAARAFADQAVRALWDAVQTGQAPIAVRAQVSMATQHAMRAAVSVTDTVFHHAGGGAIFLDSPLQRCFRDVHTAAQHVFYSAEADQRLARLRLGFDEPTIMI